MKRRGALFALALACGGAGAFTGVQSSYSGGITTTTSTGPGMATITTAPGSGARVGGLVHMASPTGQTAEGRMLSTVTRRGVGVMAGRALAAVLGSPVTWAGLVIWDLYSQVRVAPDRQGGLVVDAGTPPVDSQVYCVTLPSLVEKCASSPSAAVTYLVNYYNASNSEDVPGSGQDAVFQLGYCDAVGCFIGVTRYTNGVITTPYNAYGGKVDPTLKTGPICPPYSGQFAEVYSEAPGADGKCWGGQVAPITPEQAAAIAEAVQSIDWAQIMREVTGRDPAAPWPAGQVEHEIDPTGPVPTAPGRTTTQQNSQGTVTTAGEFRLTDILPRNGRGAQGRWVETTTTTQRDTAGNVVGTPTTATTSGPAGTTEPAPDPCKDNPNRVGCMDAGEVEDTELQTREVPISVVPMAGWGPATAACPPPRTISLGLGGTVTVPFTALCDFASGVRPFVLGIAALTCAFVLLGMRQGAEA